MIRIVKVPVVVGEVVATGAPAGSPEVPGETAGGSVAVVGDVVTACKTLDLESKGKKDASTKFPLSWAEATATAMTEMIRRVCIMIEVTKVSWL